MKSRKVFLDIGGHLGETVKKFYEEAKDPLSWVYYTFEPNPVIFKKLIENLKGIKVKCYNLAITGTDEKTRKLFIGKRHEAEGSTIVPGKITGKVDYEKPVIVKAVKLSDFINKCLKPTDRIALKMNIEGAEYEIMQHILDSGLMSRFNQIYVQLHKDKMTIADIKFSDIEQKFYDEAALQGVRVYFADKDMNNLISSSVNNPTSRGTRPIRVAHFGEFAPHRCGLYGTMRELIMAERWAGLDAALIYVTVEKGKVVYKKPDNIKDGDLPIKDIKWANQADILVRHSVIPPKMEARGIPIIMAIHGRPESSFLLEHRRVMSIFTAATSRAEQDLYKAYFTFWEEYMFHQSTMIPKEKLHYIPAMVDLEEYNPMGKGYKFDGEPKLLVVDMWRHDITPYNVLMAAERFREKYCPKAKVHIIGANRNKSSIKTLKKVLKVIGEVHPLITTIGRCYRGADIVITPHNIATRVIRESLACGTPIVAGSYCKYTPFRADPQDIDAYASAINDCWQYIQRTNKPEVEGVARRMAENNFDPQVAGTKIKAMYEKVLSDEEGRWVLQEGMQRRTYGNYDKYLKHQKSKSKIGFSDMDLYDRCYHKDLRARLKKLEFIKKGMNALCLGARFGTECKAFLDVGCFTIGVDLYPGNNNNYVVTGDFHNIKYPDSSVDIVFTNSIDHIYRINRFMREVKRVLRPEGYFIFDIHGPEQIKGNDKWSCLWWSEYDDLLSLFQEFNLNVISEVEIDISKCGIKSFKYEICMQDTGDV